MSTFFGGSNFASIWKIRFHAATKVWWYTYLNIDTLEPFGVRHINIQGDIQMTLLNWIIVHRHAFIAQDDELARFYGPAGGTGDLDAAAIEVINQYSGKSKECL